MLVMRKHQLLGKVCKLTSSFDVLKHMICVYPITVLKIKYCMLTYVVEICTHTQTDKCCSTLKPKIADKTTEKENSMKSNKHLDEKLFTPDSVRYSSPSPLHILLRTMSYLNTTVNRSMSNLIRSFCLHFYC